MKSKVVKKKNDSEVYLLQLKNQLARTLADYDNLKKRVENEKEVWFSMASARVIGRILPILDNLENMQKHLQDQGLAISIVEFKKVLVDEGFTEINPVAGESFNEEQMEAVEAIDGGESGTVCEVVLSGWSSKDSVLRHAKVKVYK